MDESPVIRFMWAVQALSQAADVQIGLYPEFVEVADELALEHDEAQQPFLDLASRDGLTCAQRNAIDALDRYLESVSGPENIDLWTVEALRTAAEWNRVRVLAQSVLREMDWPEEVPPRERGAMYVGEPMQRRQRREQGQA